MTEETVEDRFRERRIPFLTDVCPECRKVIFRTWTQAKSAARRQRRQGNSVKVEPYRCPHRNGIHLGTINLKLHKTKEYPEPEDDDDN